MTVTVSVSVTVNAPFDPTGTMVIPGWGALDATVEVVGAGCGDGCETAAGTGCAWIVAAELCWGTCGAGVDGSGPGPEKGGGAWTGGFDGSGGGVEDWVVNEMLRGDSVGFTSKDGLTGTIVNPSDCDGVLVCSTGTVVVCADVELSDCTGALVAMAWEKDIASFEAELAPAPLPFGAVADV